MAKPVSVHPLVHHDVASIFDLVFYVERGDEIRILYVYHSSRNIREQMGEDVRR